MTSKHKQPDTTATRLNWQAIPEAWAASLGVLACRACISVLAFVATRGPSSCRCSRAPVSPIPARAGCPARTAPEAHPAVSPSSSYQVRGRIGAVRSTIACAPLSFRQRGCHAVEQWRARKPQRWQRTAEDEGQWLRARNVSAARLLGLHPQQGNLPAPQEQPNAARPCWVAWPSNTHAATAATQVPRSYRGTAAGGNFAQRRPAACAARRGHVSFVACSRVALHCLPANTGTHCAPRPHTLPLCTHTHPHSSRPLPGRHCAWKGACSPCRPAFAPLESCAAQLPGPTSHACLSGGRSATPACTAPHRRPKAAAGASHVRTCLEPRAVFPSLPTHTNTATPNNAIH